VSISPVSSSSINTPQNSNDNTAQQFAQLAQAIQSGDTSAAQQAYAAFTQSPAGQAASSNPDSPLGQALSQIGQSLESGDVSGAQQALSSLKPHGGHHHRGASGGAQQTAAAPAGAPPSDPNAPGAHLNITA
jgi:hypothetical protein